MSLVYGYETNIGSSRAGGNLGRWTLSGSTGRGRQFSPDARVLFHTGYAGAQSTLQLMNSLLAFLTTPQAAPPGSGISVSGRGPRHDPDCPEGVTPSRYVTGYGQEAYIMAPPWSTITAYDLNTGKIK